MSILGLLLAGAVLSTAIKVGVVVIGAHAYRARRRRSKAQGTPTSVSDQAPPEERSP